jgi:transcriptional regulator with XRE-family HTH domain
VIAYEKGRTIPQADVLISICNRFNLDLNYFIDPDTSNNIPYFEGDAPSNQTNTTITLSPDDKTKINIEESKIENKQIIKKFITLDFKTYESEFKKDKKEFNLKKITIPSIIIIFCIFITIYLILFKSLLWIWLSPVITLAGLCRTKLIKRYYIKHFELKLDKITKEKFPLTPQYNINLKLLDKGIYIYHNDEIIFYCPYEQFDHSDIYTNKIRVRNFFLRSSEQVISHSFRIFTKEHYYPYIINFPLFYKNQQEEKAIKELNALFLIKFLNECIFELNKIKTKK